MTADQALAAGQLTQALKVLGQLLQRAPDDIDALRLAGRALLRAGRSAEAAAACRRIIAIAPQQADAVANLALAQRRLGAEEAAEATLRRALRIDPDRAEFHFNLGNLLRAGMRYDPAGAAFRRAAALKPELPEAWCNLGLCQKDLDCRTDALRNLERAVTLKQSFTEARINVAALLIGAGRFVEGLAACDEVLRIAPLQSGAWRSRGIALHVLNQPSEAESALKAGLMLAPDDSDGWSRLAQVHQQAKDVAAAEIAFLRALRLDPDSSKATDALCGLYLKQNRPDDAGTIVRDAVVRAPGCVSVLVRLSKVLCRQSRFPEGERWGRRALAMNAEERAAMSCITSALTGQHRFDDAVDWTRRTMVLYPDDARMYANAQAPLVEMRRWSEVETLARHAVLIDSNNGAFRYGLAMALKHQGRIVESLAQYDEAARVAPDAPNGRFARAIALLAAGRTEEGLAEYEWRWTVPNFPSGRQLLPKPTFPQPVWDGGPLNGRTLLAWGEQGVGDEIWDSGYLSLLPDGTRCVVECDHRLVTLYRRSFPNAVVVERTAPPDLSTLNADVQCAMGGLAWRLDAASRPVPFAYLKPRADAVQHLRRRYRRNPGPVIGIAWRSVKPIPHRSFIAPLGVWGAVLTLPGVNFVSLQYGDVQADLAEAHQIHGVEVLADTDLDALKSLDALAAQVAACDAVISIANSTIPMAHAVGRPAFAILRRDQHDWRYTVDQQRSRWFPTVQAFWPQTQDDWGTVLERVGTAVQDWLSGSDGAERYASGADARTFTGTSAK